MELTVWQSQLKAHELLIPHSFFVDWTHTEEPMASAQIAVGVLVPLLRKTLHWGGLSLSWCHPFVHIHLYTMLLSQDTKLSTVWVEGKSGPFE